MYEELFLYLFLNQVLFHIYLIYLAERLDQIGWYLLRESVTKKGEISLNFYKFHGQRWALQLKSEFNTSRK